MSETIKAYKGFNEDMTCTPPNTDIKFQYEEGKEYEESKAKACERGFHACEYPLDCFGYYAPSESVYHEVVQSGEISRSNDDSKLSSTKIKIGASINIAGMIKAAIEYTTKRVKKETDSDSELWSVVGNLGLWSVVGNRGLWSVVGNQVQGSVYRGRKRKHCCCMGLQVQSKRCVGFLSCFC